MGRSGEGGRGSLLRAARRGVREMRGLGDGRIREVRDSMGGSGLG